MNVIDTPCPTPMTLGERVRPRAQQILHRAPGVLAYPHHWQVPAATERAAFEAVSGGPAPVGFEYVGVAWATVIDGLRGDAPAAADVLMAVRQLCDAIPPAQRRATVAQHIHALEFIDLFKAAGITDLFWSHATHDVLQVDGIRMHPFPLFPAQTPDAEPPADVARPRRYLANFIGAYNPRIYLTNVRGAIFDDAGKDDALLIIKRDAWHFDRAVYEEQIQGRSADVQRKLVEQRQAQEYLDAIRDSWFTLCPSGSGPNSIRVFESLCLGSIPVILTKSLRLPGDAAAWEAAAVIEEDSVEGYRRAKLRLRSISAEQRAEMLQAGRRLFAKVAPRSYGALLHGALAA